MKCPRCQAENREDVNFCDQYGARMEVECPNRNARIPLGKKSCGRCGQPPSPLRGKALPSTSLPGEIHEIMDGCFKILMDEIHG